MLSFYRDFVHAGGCVLSIIVPGVWLPLPYWYQMGMVPIMSTLWSLHNGWHCKANLAPDYLDQTVAYLSQVGTISSPLFVVLP